MKDDTDKADPHATHALPVPSPPVADPKTTSDRHSNSGSGRLEVRCPNCHQPTEVAVDTTLTDLTCSACGSHFSLVDQGEATRMAPSLSKLGRFDLIERIGVGGFGSVWKARDKDLDRTVAIKIPRASGMSGEEQEQFFREARAAAQLHHPSIVSVHEVGRDGDSIYIVSDFVRGVTLGDWRTGQQLTSREAAELCAKIADALHHAHEQGVIHRDLKPANVMIDGDGQPHLMDFGLARREVGEVSVTMDGQVLGTPAYMSPEQAQGKAHTADRRSDVYSLGVVLFQLLSGELPFRGNARMLVHQVINEPAPSPRKLNGNVPKDLETITLRCLEKDAAKRYQSARDLADELRRFLSGMPIHARPVGRAERALRWARRNKTVATLTAAMFLLLLSTAVGAAVAAVWFQRAAAVSEQAKQGAIDARNLALQSQTNEQAARVLAEHTARDNRLSLYAARIFSAQQVWEMGDLSRAIELLDSLRPQPGKEDLRGFEWYYLWRLCHSESKSFLGHTLAVRRVAFSPNGKTLATVCDDGTVKLWDVASGRLRSTLQTPAQAVAFSPEGKFLAVGERDNTIELYDSNSLRKLAVLNGHTEPINCLAFSPDGQTLLSGTAHGPWEVTAFYPLDRFLTPNSEGQLILWDVRRNEKLRSFTPHGAGVLAVAFSKDGKSFISVDRNGNVNQSSAVSDEKHQIPSPIGGSRAIVSAALSRDAMMLAIGTADSNLHNADVKIWNLSDQHEIASWTGPTGPALSLVFSPDNKSLGCGKYDQTISVFDVESRQLRHSIIGHEGYVFSAAFAPDNKSIATGSADGPVKLWSTTAKQQCDFFEEPESGGYSLALNRSGDILATSGHHSVMLWDVASGQMLAALEGYDHLHSGIYVLFNPRGDLLATAAEGGVVRLWDVKSLKPVARWQAHDAQIRTMAFSPDGRTLATASRDETVVKLWDVESKKRRATLTHEGGIRSLAFSPDGRELASACKPKGSESSVVNIWNLSTLQINKSLPASQTGLSWVAWAPNGDVFAMGNGDRRVKLLQTGTWRELRQFKAHTNLIMQGEFSSDGKTLATASWDGTAKLWHVATGEQLLSFQTTGPCGALALSNDNKLVVTGVQTGTHEAIALWRAARTDETTHSGNATTRRQTSK